MKLNVDSSEKRTDVKSCEVLNSYFKKNADDVLTIILTQILEEMNFNSENDASEIKKTAHMKSDSSISIFSMKTHATLTVKLDFKISESD